MLKRTKENLVTAAAGLLLIGIATVPVLVVQQIASAGNGIKTIVAAAGKPATTVHVAGKNGVRQLEWPDLVPANYRPDEILKKYNANQMKDTDPRAKQLLKELQMALDKAPVVQALNGVTVRLPGFVVPLEGDGKVVSEFLLVPYFGACIHVPPPPANQTVYVMADGANARIHQLFDMVWVTGVMSVKRTASDLGDAGYTIRATTIEPYEVNDR